MTRTIISKSDLAKKTQEVLDRVQLGEIVVVESSGHEQTVVLDSLDFRLLRALAQCAIDKRERESVEGPDVHALHLYLAAE